MGVHVRRGDITGSTHVAFGHTVPTKEYYTHAADFLRGKGILDPVYIVCTNDESWVMDNLLFANMYLVQGQTAEIDMVM